MINRIIFTLSLYLIFDGFSFGQCVCVGGSDTSQQAPSWKFDFDGVVFNAEYGVVPADPGPPLVPRHRQLVFSEMRLYGGKFSNIANITPIAYKIKVFDSGSNLLYSEPFPFNANGRISNVQSPLHAAASPPVTIRIDLQSPGGIWYEGPHILTVGSATQNTTWTASALDNWNVDTVIHWSYAIPTPSEVPNMRVGLYNIKNPNLPWQQFEKVWESDFNADSSFGWWRIEGFHVESPYRFLVGQPPLQQCRTYFMSGILAVNEQPVGIFYPTVSHAEVATVRSPDCCFVNCSEHTGRCFRLMRTCQIP